MQGRQIQNFGRGGGGRLLWIEVRKPPVCPSVSVIPSVPFSSWLLILSPRFGKTGAQYPQLGRCVTFTKLINLWKVQLYTSNCNSYQEATSHVAAAYAFDLYPKNLPWLHCLLFFGWGKWWLLQELSCIVEWQGRKVPGKIPWFWPACRIQAPTTVVVAACLLPQCIGFACSSLMRVGYDCQQGWHVLSYYLPVCLGFSCVSSSELMDRIVRVFGITLQVHHWVYLLNTHEGRGGRKKCR